MPTLLINGHAVYTRNEWELHENGEVTLKLNPVHMLFNQYIEQSVMEDAKLIAAAQEEYGNEGRN